MFPIMANCKRTNLLGSLFPDGELFKRIISCVYREKARGKELGLGDVSSEELCCFLQIDQFIFQMRHTLIITINGENGQVFLKSSGRNQGINISNVFMK